MVLVNEDCVEWWVKRSKTQNVALPTTGILAVLSSSSLWYADER